MAVAHRADSLHLSAAAFYKQALSRYRRLITSSLIAAETYALLRREYRASAALQWLADLLASERVEIVYHDRRLIEEATRLLARYADQAFSLTDALSFVIMRERGVV
ncbi:MAG: type II toxin-antitoxin system VapC family toxin, partial [Armatimonadota bacterium]